MKLYISVDMEGLAGITHWKDETEERERFRKAMAAVKTFPMICSVKRIPEFG